MITERRDDERQDRDEQNDTEWRTKIQRALRDLRSMSNAAAKSCATT